MHILRKNRLSLVVVFVLLSPCVIAFFGVPRAYAQSCSNYQGTCETTDVRPALAGWNGPAGNLLYMAWTGRDSAHHLNLAWSTDGVNLLKVDVLTDTTLFNAGPALAAYGSYLYLAWTGTDKRLNVEAFDGIHVLNKVTLPDTTNASPALANFDKRLYLAWTGTDGRLNIEWTTSPACMTCYDHKQTFSNKALFGPTLSPGSYGTLLDLGWYGTDSPALVWVNRTVDGTTWSGATPILDSTPNYEPTLSPSSDFSSQVLMYANATQCNSGACYLVYQVSTDGLNFSSQRPVYELTTIGQAMAVYNGAEHFAWIEPSSNNILNAAVLSGV